MRVIVAITAASGAIYARQVVELLLADASVEKIAIIYSRNARDVVAYEGVSIPESDRRVVICDNDDMFASVASGSAEWDSMVIVPCSVGTASRIAMGLSDSLIGRAADVMLKERRRLLLVVRETPLSLIHLRNLTALTEAGAIVMPASPSYYNRASTIDDLAMSVSRRAVSMIGCAGGVEPWEGKK